MVSEAKAIALLRGVGSASFSTGFGSGVLLAFSFVGVERGLTRGLGSKQ